MKVWRLLRSIIDEDLICRISFQINKSSDPDFLLIYRNKSAFLLRVSHATTEILDDYVQRSLSFEGQVQPSGLENENSINLFTKEVLQGFGTSSDVKIQSWVLFPNASREVVHRLKESWQGGSPCEFFAKEECRNDVLLDNIKKASQQELSEAAIRRIVGRFSPESAIPEDWVSQSESSSGDDSKLQLNFLLDYDQENAMKSDLELSGEAFKVASSGKISLVTGTAGCGKTLILLFRARLEASLDTSRKILVLMHNKPLRADLVNRAKELGMSGNIEWCTFYSWMRSMLGKEFNIIPKQELNSIITQCLEECGKQKEFKCDFLLKEFEWISDNGPEGIGLEWYLKSPRVGRKRSLKENQRRIVYDLYCFYRKKLDEKNWDHWPVLPRIFLKKIINGEIKCKQYHTIYIDEAQFFAQIWFQCVRKAFNQENGGRLFVVADPTQGFLRSGQSWVKILGADMRGRSQRLQKPYRNTREIMSFAKKFYMSRAISEEDEVNIPTEEAIRKMPSGNEPKLIKIGRQSATKIIVDQLNQLVDQSGKHGSILFIDASGESEKTQLDLLQKYFPRQVISAASATDRSKTRVTTIGACTGLESPVVVLVGLDRLLEKEEALNLDSIEREELIKSNTKKIFVAITRAAQKLVVIYRNDNTLKKLLASHSPEAVRY